MRTVAGLIGLAPSVRRDDRSDSLDVRGVVPRWALDGVLLPAGVRLPLGVIDQARVEPGPLRAGDAAGRGGRIDLRSHEPHAGPWYGRLDARGGTVGGDGRATDVGGRLGGSLVGDRLRVVVGGRAVRDDDASPSARPLPRLTDAALDRIRAAPQLLRIDDGTGRAERYVPLDGAAPGTPLAALVPGVDASRVSVVSALDAVTDADLTTSTVRRGAAGRRGEGFARVEAWLSRRIHLDALHTGTLDDGERFEASTSLVEAGQARARTSSTHSRLRLTARAAPGAEAGVTAARTRLHRTGYRAGFGTDVRSVLGYHDIDDPRNAVAARYRSLRTPASNDSPALVALYSDLAFPSTIGLYGLYAAPGALATGYETDETTASTVRAEATWQRRSHRLDGGVDAEQTVERSFAIGTAGLRRMATLFADRPPETPGGPATCDFDFTGASCRDAFDAYTFGDLYGFTRYAGMRYNGTGRGDAPGARTDLTAYAACVAAPQACPDGPGEAPARTRRAGAWASDRVAWGAFTLDAGLRVDAFARGGLAFADPYATVPVVTAASAGLDGGPIGATWVPYYQGSVLAGFRDRRGRYYTPTGAPSTYGDIVTQVDVRPRLLVATPRLDARAFRTPRTHLAVQPRVALAVALPSAASVFAYAASTAEAAPTELAHLRFADAERALYGATFLPNPDLPPLRATSFGGGGSGTVGPFRLGTELWQRTDTGVPVAVRRASVPSPYTTAEGRGTRRQRGLDVQAEHRRERVYAGVSWSIWQERARNLFVNPYYELDQAAPTLVRDVLRQRVLVHVNATSGATAGPALGAFRPLGRWSVEAAYHAQSGEPYARLLAPYPLYHPVSLSGPRSLGYVPWAHRVDLAASRTLVDVPGHRVALTVRAENVFARRNVRRVWRATGLPDEDGFLATASGRFQVPPGSPAERAYRLRLVDPLAYGLGRLVHVGLRWVR